MALPFIIVYIDTALPAPDTHTTPQDPHSLLLKLYCRNPEKNETSTKYFETSTINHHLYALKGTILGLKSTSTA